MPIPAEAIHLVYDARAGAITAAFDGAKKLLGLSSCPLCAITHGVATERRAWKTCRAALGLPVRTWHSDDLPHALRAVLVGGLPAVAAEVAGAYRPLLGPADIRACGASPERLAERIADALAAP